MTISEKYSKVLTIKKKKAYKAEDELGFGRNTLSNAIKGDRLMSEDYHNKFIKHYSVNPKWWETERGEIFLTSVPETDTKEKEPDPEEYRLLKNSLARFIDTNEFLLEELKAYKERFGPI